MKKTSSLLLFVALISSLTLLGACKKAEEPGEETAEAPAAQPAEAPSEAPAAAETPYEAADVTGGGSLSGSVKLAGDVPPPAPLEITKDAAVCGMGKHPSEALMTGAGGVVQLAVVQLTNISKGKALDAGKTLVLDQKKCKYDPHVQLVPVNSIVEVKNSDPVLHNVHAYFGETETLFNIAQPFQGQTTQRSLTRPGVVHVKCDAHPWMSAYFVVQAHPYYAVSDKAGNFKISDIPPGTYKVKVWHEYLGSQEQDVTIEGGKDAKADFQLTKS